MPFKKTKKSSKAPKTKVMPSNLGKKVGSLLVAAGGAGKGSY